MARLLATVPLLLIFSAGCGDDTSGFDRVDVALPPDGHPFLEVSDELWVTSDGTVYRAVDEPLGIWMVPLPTGGPTWEVAELTAEGRDLLLAFLDAQGFFDPPPDYSAVMVTDVVENRLVVTTADATFEHVAYVDFVDDNTGGAAYRRYRTVLAGLRDLPSLVEGGIGEFEPYVPASWDVVQPFGPQAPDYLQDEVEEWPFAAPAQVGCTTFPGDEVVVDGADAATGRYESEGAVFDVEARFPWDGPC